MFRILFILLISCVALQAQFIPFGFVGNNPVAASYFLSEKAEGTGTPAGWTDSAGAPNWDNTTNVIEGSQSVTLLLADRSDSPTWVNTGTGYFFFEVKLGPLPANNSTLLSVLDNPISVNILNVEYRTTGELRMVANSGSQAATLLASATPGTIYYIWLDATKGTGANGVCHGYISTSAGTKGSSGGSPDATIINSGVTVNSASVRLNGPDTSFAVYDHILSSASDIGSNPP